MTDLTKQVEKIAQKLTKSQRVALRSANMQFSVLLLSAAPSALHALKRKGLTKGTFADAPTSLGLAVRAYLMENPDDS